MTYIPPLNLPKIDKWPELEKEYVAKIKNFEEFEKTYAGWNLLDEFRKIEVENQIKAHKANKV